MSDEDLDEADEPMRTRTKVVAVAIVAVALLGALALTMRVGSPAIAPAQAPPAGHYGLPCALCHTMSADAPMIGVR
jgi:hypothetical protein